MSVTPPSPVRSLPWLLVLLAGCGGEVEPTPAARTPAARTPPPAARTEPEPAPGSLPVTIRRAGDDAPELRELWLARGERKVFPERKQVPVYWFENLDLEEYTLEVRDSEGVRHSFPGQRAGVPFEVVLEKTDWSSFDLGETEESGNGDGG